VCQSVDIDVLTSMSSTWICFQPARLYWSTIASPYRWRLRAKRRKYRISVPRRSQ